MAANKVKLLGAGSPLLDVLVNVDDGFVAGVEGAKGGMELVDIAVIDAILARTAAGRVKAPGGSAVNTVFGLAKLGVPTGFLGKLGKDDDGVYYTARLAAAGVDVSGFKHSPDTRTGLCLSMVTPDSERTMRTFLGAAATLSPDEVADADFQGYTHLHMEGYLLFNPPLARRILELAKRNGLSVSLDFASFEVVRANQDALPGLIADFVDVVFANEVEAEQFAGSKAPEAFFKALEGRCAVAALKLGRDGAIVRADGVEAKVPAKLVKAVDTTGAGDLWQAGFLFGLLNGRPLRDCALYGSELGAEVVQILGAEIPEQRWPSIKTSLGGS